MYDNIKHYYQLRSMALHKATSCQSPLDRLTYLADARAAYEKMLENIAALPCQKPTVPDTVTYNGRTLKLQSSKRGLHRYVCDTLYKPDKVIIEEDTRLEQIRREIENPYEF